MPTKNQFKRLLVDGFHAEQTSDGPRFVDPCVSLVKNLAKGLLGLEPEVLGAASDSRIRLNSDCLILLSWANDFAYLDRLTKKASVVVQVPNPDSFAPEAVARYLGRGLVYCFTEEMLEEPQSIETVKECLRRTLNGQNPFGLFDWTTLNGSAAPRPKRIFLSRPDRNKDLLGIPSVLKALNIECVDPLESGGGGVLNHSVRTKIDRSDGVIGHFGQVFVTGKEGEEFIFYNANVMYELGYASGTQKPMVLFGDSKDPGRWPADLQGCIVGNFRNAIEVVQRVYYGLV